VGGDYGLAGALGKRFRQLFSDLMECLDLDGSSLG